MTRACLLFTLGLFLGVAIAASSTRYEVRHAVGDSYYRYDKWTGKAWKAVFHGSTDVDIGYPATGWQAIPEDR